MKNLLQATHDDVGSAPPTAGTSAAIAQVEPTNGVLSRTAQEAVVVP